MQKMQTALRELIGTLKQPLSKHLPESTCDQVISFASQLYENAAVDELALWPEETFYGTTLSLWNFLQEYKKGAPRLEVFNPDFEKHGWQSSHTLIQVLNPDMPFLVDSLRMELNRRNLTVHTIHNAIFGCQRNNKGLLQQVGRADAEKLLPESLILIEVDRISDDKERHELRDGLLDVLTEVRTAVEDFAAMRNKALECSKILAGKPLQKKLAKALDASALDEAALFFEWLADNHFTFLGYDEYRLEDQDGIRQLCKVKGSELGLLKLPDNPAARCVPESDPSHHNFILIPDLLSFAKAPAAARVHRPAHPDYISIKTFDSQGQIIGEQRFMGLYTSAVYNQTPRDIPVLRQKVRAVMERIGMVPSTHNGRQLMQLLDVYPRDDLFQIDLDELTSTALGIFNLRERRKVRVFIRKDSYGKLYSALVYVPRDIYSTELRRKTQKVLCEALDADFIEFTTYFSESVLCRTQFILRFRKDEAVDYDLKEIEQRIIQVTRSWNDSLYSALSEIQGEEQANQLIRLYRDGFSAAYCEDFTPRHAVNDINHFEMLKDGKVIALSLYRTLEEADQLRFKLYQKGQPLLLSDVLPVLENLGLKVLGERPYEIIRDGETCWMHDFSLNLALKGNDSLDLAQIKDTFQTAFLKTWLGQAESDAFNRLVLAAGLDWRKVAMLRGYARYMKQIGSTFSQDYIAATLVNHPDITRKLAQLFSLRFDPDQKRSEAACNQCISQIDQAMEKVDSLTEDRILRRYLELIQATLRTNFFQLQSDGQPRAAISFKLNPAAISDIPQPCPRFEIFVYSPRVEGVHLRYGKVARGGLRWSDRHEDFRTEVLGLVKAQQVKNAVIVPVGAKGGFICKQMPDNPDRETFMAEGIACYQTFIRSLLDVTDNLIQDQIVPPQRVVRQDEDDPYLVVAADKGTATFSDIANAISADYGFWLGDAFASGGSAGYDHKKMGITARGAWVSVQRHFRELGVDVQKDEFTVLGIGDMSGDVFGNGLLLSDKILLTAAFNHKHIFVDPNPDAEKSFKERQRLFALPRSGWDDYKAELISEGGGIFSREAKSIVITPQMKERFAITADRLTPADLISALLQAPVDLIWNGGIGTYVKSRLETHADAGDKANDVLRIDGHQLRCKVIGEGGNLGFTQKGRIEAARAGVKVNTDFIDNAGGVNCSDHEVNIKILLQQVMQAGDLTLKQRDELLERMTEEVAQLVLRDNYSQAQALAIAQLDSRNGLGHYRRLISTLEEEGKLNRTLENLPDDASLQEREAERTGLTRPELAVLLAYAKADIKNAVLESEVPEDPWLGLAIKRAFPEVILERYAEPLSHHRLKRELITTMLVNELVDHMGITFVHRLKDTAGLSVPDIVRGYAVSRDVFDIVSLWNAIEGLDHRVDAALQLQLMHDLTRMMRRATRWFVRNRFTGLTAREAVDHFAPRVQLIAEQIGQRLSGDDKLHWEARRDQLLASGVPEQLAERLAGIGLLYSALNIIQAERDTGQNLALVTEAYFLLGQSLQLPWLKQQITDLAVHDSWEAMAREAYRDELDDRHRLLTVSLLTLEDGASDLQVRMEQWLTHFGNQTERWNSLLHEVRGGSNVGYPLFAVAMRQLAVLSMSDIE
ncbi:NAD-glutamate dehydrogenase [Marinospirillum alkaliphilum]|uniref:Glutamate dehydrogenase (NAD) n=1 Tax=Marinospirillum alkaliphilum DSM 21637 TaxID=1122209 RepID=A0A1K1YH36_9GAMM|nr:NAD-glutamate dehydrogenase [Marinospirillum alkaliphilum]SFX60677.1 glutamate dehydrogenase (NAD) [Marinospirillum alkaliphilum DSM 21637]